MSGHHRSSTSSALTPGRGSITRPADPVTSGNANGRTRRYDTGSNFTRDPNMLYPGCTLQLEMAGQSKPTFSMGFTSPPVAAAQKHGFARGA
jgi:hypothetical protein